MCATLLLMQLWPPEGVELPANWGMYVMKPPRPTEKGTLAFVAIRLANLRDVSHTENVDICLDPLL